MHCSAIPCKEVQKTVLYGDASRCSAILVGVMQCGQCIGFEHIVAHHVLITCVDTVLCCAVLCCAVSCCLLSASVVSRGVARRCVVVPSRLVAKCVGE